MDIERPLPLPTCVSLDQLLGIWDDLARAYHGTNGYGGNTAEVYNYRLREFSPRILHESWRPAVESEQEATARSALAQILRRFESDWQCKCTVDGVSVDEWQRSAYFDHRCHVLVEPKD